MNPKLEQIYYREMFKPSLLGLFINPYYIIRKRLYECIDSKKSYLKGRLLDFGCGSKPYKDLVNVEEHIGVDIEVSGHPHEHEQIDAYYDGKTIPFDDNHFDSVLSSEVLEHVFNLEQILSELYRVMKPGGHMLITLPFVWDEHEIPYDFARYTSFGIDHLLSQSGFEVVVIEKNSSYVETIFQMWNAYVYQTVLPSNRVVRVLMTPFFIAPVTILGIIFSKILPKNENFYHNNVVVAKKPITEKT
jgi:ubiquinone/menaquinone biosynthesis C-methylase UbiE